MTGDKGTGASRPDMEKLFKVCAAAAYRSAFSVLRSPSDAEDVAQEACVEVLLAIEDGKRDEEKAAEYAATSAYHRALKWKRRRARENVLEESLTVPMNDPRRSATELAWHACEKLNPARRTAVVMTVVQGFNAAEVGRVIGVETEAAHKLVQRGIDQMLKICVERIGRRRGMPAGCDGRSGQIYKMIVGRLAASEQADLEGHLTTCQYCRDTQEQLDLARQLPAFTPLFPLDGILARKSDVLRRVAERAMPPTPAPRSRLQPSRVIGGSVALLILVIGVTSIPTLRSLPPARIAAAPAPSTSPSPIPSPAPSSTPVPPVPSGGFAYLKSGEVYYQSDFGAAPVQLTSTGGLVDDWYWTGSGTSIIYKQRAPRSQAGDLYLVDLVSHQVTWSYKVGAAALAVSPDGASYVAVLPTQIGTGYNAQFSYRLLIGSIGSNPDPAREVDLRTVTSSQVVGYLTEYPPVNVRANFAGPAVWWTLAGIHFEPAVSDAGFDIDPNTKAVVERQLSNVFDAERVYSGPTISQIQDVFGNLEVTSGGITRTIDFRSTHGPVMILSVSADESRGLATVLRSDGGHDVYLVTANGDVTPLSTDGSTLLAAWQPATTQ